MDESWGRVEPFFSNLYSFSFFYFAVIFLKVCTRQILCFIFYEAKWKMRWFVFDERKLIKQCKRVGPARVWKKASKAIHVSSKYVERYEGMWPWFLMARWLLLQRREVWLLVMCLWAWQSDFLCRPLTLSLPITSPPHSLSVTLPSCGLEDVNKWGVVLSLYFFHLLEWMCGLLLPARRLTFSACLLTVSWRRHYINLTVSDVVVLYTLPGLPWFFFAPKTALLIDAK